MVPYVAVCLFAGLRPGETEQLRWEQIDFDTGFIQVLGETSKTRQGRYAKMEPCLIEWLKPYRQAAGKIIGPRSFRRAWESVKAAAGYVTRGRGSEPWVPDVMRHSFASYWLAVHQDRAKLAELMGNSVDVIRSFYRVPALETVAQKFWELKP